ncbi:type IX secretion system sortase PorU [Hyunsoonleella sp. 2307UL5-6]|uniref:type IX secretion system sortase PorU n=1 Tax=Hyunsoonleella sp. 2307UL5-6 TaxID=3384768 RepID=UPI0039BC3B54
MKEKILVILLLVSSFVYSQKKNFSIDWNGTTTLTFGTNALELPYFNQKNYSYDFDDGLQFIAQWEIQNTIDESSVTISNTRYQSISKQDLFGMDISKINTAINISLKNSKSRNRQFGFLELSPIVKDENGGYKKLLSFQVNYNYINGVSNRSRSSKNFRNSKIISNSVLNSGDWYKFYVDTTGVFRLTKSFLQNLGVDVNNVDPRTIKIFGNGGRMIPFSNSEPYPFDIAENAIKVIGEQDGEFDNEDFVVFYAQGPKEFNLESNTNINSYTDKTYYYITSGGNLGKRIQPIIQPTGPVDLVVDSYQQYKFIERDIHNIGTVGRRWFGARFNIDNNQDFKFNFPELITTEPVVVKVYAAAVSSASTSMGISVNGNLIRNLNFGTTSNTVIGSDSFYSGTVNINSDDVIVNLNYDNKSNPSSQAYLDYISVEATRPLKFNSTQFQFKNNAVVNSSGIAQYTISEASRLSEVWDVTDIYNIKTIENNQGETEFAFTATMGEEKVYVALSPSDYFQPKQDRSTLVRNQNIKGTIFNNADGSFQDIDYLIVTPNNMFNEAERLAQINRNRYGLNVKVVGLDEIYAEFSTSNQDIGAIRNLVKYIYDNASNPNNRIKFLCLFGDGSYDYKDRIPNNTNIVPSWHSYNSLNLTNSFVSDDFFGMMDDNEGTMANSDRLDIAVGRILADSPQRAKDLVDKIETYYAKESFGRWRNNYVVVSDDVDKDWEGIIQETTDSVGNQVTSNKPFVNVIKIHTDAFNQESSAGGERYPDVVEEFSNAIDNGALVVNYFGHGGEDGLAEERILDIPSINNFKNFCRLNCFVTVTCEFTKFDNPFRKTAGEFTYWNKEAGAISLITTTRQVFVNFGTTFNNTLGEYLFSFSDNDTFGEGEYPSAAEALRLTKNDATIGFAAQRRLVFYIGDPAMQLAFPKPNIKLTALNDVPIAQATDTLKALSKVKLAGEITDVNGNVLSNYNGVVSTTIYDKFIERQTLANNNTRNAGVLVKLDFETLGAIIFRGQATVANGQFEFDFVVPKDIGVPVGLGRVSLYAKNEQLSEDQSGADITNIRIGGVNENAEVDNVGPVINLFMNDENFVSGGITNESPTLLAKLEDANGINTASGIGHDISAIIDGDETNPFVLNDYYETEVDAYQKGTVSFPFRNLEPGLHTLTLKAWDVYNNSSTSEIQFIVFDQDQELVINNVLNYPNPFVNYTEFWFNHNSSEPLDVSIQIFTVSGKLVRTLNGQTSGGIKATSSLSKDIVWDGRDDFGEKIGKGVYIYKLTVKSNLLNKTVEKIEKLVIL